MPHAQQQQSDPTQHYKLQLLFLNAFSQFGLPGYNLA